jgi:hypothetical protein
MTSKGAMSHQYLSPGNQETQCITFEAGIYSQIFTRPIDLVGFEDKYQRTAKGGIWRCGDGAALDTADKLSGKDQCAPPSPLTPIQPVIHAIGECIGRCSDTEETETLACLKDPRCAVDWLQLPVDPCSDCANVVTAVHKIE